MYVLGTFGIAREIVRTVSKGPMSNGGLFVIREKLLTCSHIHGNVFHV
jgi:hypothetical protein